MLLCYRPYTVTYLQDEQNNVSRHVARISLDFFVFCSCWKFQPSGLANIGPLLGEGGSGGMPPRKIVKIRSDFLLFSKDKFSQKSSFMSMDKF